MKTLLLLGAIALSINSFGQVPTSAIKCANTKGVTLEELTNQDGTAWHYYSPVSINEPNPFKESKVAFFKGVPFNGVFKYCNDEGILFATENYKEGLRHGEQSLYNHFFRGEIMGLSINNYSIGKLNDTCFFYGKKDFGKPLLISAKFIYNNGKLVESFDYKEGVLDRHVLYEKGIKKKETTYHENGNIKSVLNYENCDGHKCLHGNSLVYLEDGELDYGNMRTFFYGNRLGDTYYEENGQIKVEVFQLDESKYQINKYYPNGKLMAMKKGEGWRSTFTGVIEHYSEESLLLRKQTVLNGTITADDGSTEKVSKMEE